MANCDSESLITIIPENQCVGDSLPTINANFVSLKNQVAELNYQLPAGVILGWGGNTVPNDQWLLCDGSYHSVTGYPELYQILGEQYGPLIGSRFKVPDLRGRMPMGANASNLALTLRYPGQWGGTETVS